LAGLQASAEWPQLDAADQSKLLQRAGLGDVVVPPASNDAELLKALDASPIEAWQERRQALPAKAAAARAAAAKQIEPTSVTVKPPSATIKTEPEVTKYVEALREQLLQHVRKDETVII
jgi:hypothetical protein